MLEEEQGHHKNDGREATQWAAAAASAVVASPSHDAKSLPSTRHCRTPTTARQSITESTLLNQQSMINSVECRVQSVCDKTRQDAVCAVLCCGTCAVAHTPYLANSASGQQLGHLAVLLTSSQHNENISKSINNQSHVRDE